MSPDADETKKKKPTMKSIYELKESRKLLMILYLAGFCTMLFILVPNEPLRGWLSIPATPPIVPSTQGPTGN